MINHTKLSINLVGAAVAAFALLCPAQTGASLGVPYTPDSTTLHLWHLNEPSGLLAQDAVTSGGITLTNIGMPAGAASFTNTTFGAAAFSGLGTSVSASTMQHLLYGGAFPDVTGFADPETGAFTFEDVIKFDTDPLATIDAEFVSGDNGLGTAYRGWQ